ncbi:hypothetical protein ACQ5SP_13785 [Rhodovulum sp. YNF3179]|uniref:hypothetical protein n=1 Tax=Rhodovulum sp. YNF3179 TaxID=3425127 RepID=UPI003D32E4F2
MPRDRFFLIILCVVGAAGGTILLGALLSSIYATPESGTLAIVPAALTGYVIFRLIAFRLAPPEDDHFDGVGR